MQMRRILFLILFITSSASLSAQHYSVWLRGTLLQPINDRWSTAAELQYRFQNDVGTNNPFREHLLKSYRHWVYYKVNDNIRFELSPFAYYESYSIIQQVSDRDKAPAKEYRLTAAINLEQKLSGKLAIVNRTGLEDRMFTNNADLLRLRNKFGLLYELNSWTINAFNELLVNVSGVNKDYFFDHNRLGMSVSHSLPSHLKVELGYLHINRLLRNSGGRLQENDFVLNLTYKLNKLLK